MFHRAAQRLFLSFTCVCWLASTPAIAQDPVFSQYYAAPLQMNPAFTGSTNAPKVALNYRNQWPGIQQAYVTAAASYDQFLPYINSGIGVSVLTDNAGRGLYKTSNFNLHYAYKVQFRNRWQMRMGIQTGLINTRVDWSQLVFLDQLDPEFGAISPGGIPYPTDEIPPEGGNGLTVLDVSTGFLVFNDLFYGGITLKHLNTPEFSFLKINSDLLSGLPVTWSVHAGAEIDLFQFAGVGSAFMAPSVQFVQQGVQNQLNIGTIFRYDKVGTGVWYRHSNLNPDALIFLVEGRHDIFRIGYTYDLTVSSLNGTGGAHELSVIMTFDTAKKESKYNDCFNLFR